MNNTPEQVRAGANVSLTPREREVYGLVLKAESNKGIARKLVISERTASNHIAHIAHKLGIHVPTSGKVRSHFMLRESEGLGNLTGLDLSSRISPRQQEVVGCVMKGMQNKQIAEELGISRKTVNNHLHQIYRRLDVVSRWDLMRLGLQVCPNENPDDINMNNTPEQVRAGVNVSLTPREREVYELVLKAASNKQIARSLTCSARAVENYVHNIACKMDISAGSEGVRRQLILRAAGELEGPAVGDNLVLPKNILSAREQEVYGLIAKTYSNKEIAATLVISVRTAENYVYRISRKLGIPVNSGTYLRIPLMLMAIKELGNPLAEVEAGQRLSPRLQEVLVCLMKGMNNMRISSELGLSENTVKHYRTQLLDQLGAVSRYDIVRAGMRVLCQQNPAPQARPDF